MNRGIYQRFHRIRYKRVLSFQTARLGSTKSAFVACTGGCAHRLRACVFDTKCYDKLVRVIQKIRTLLRYQGVGWLAFRAGYAMRLRSGWFKWKTPSRAWEENPTHHIAELSFFSSATPIPHLGSAAAVRKANEIVQGTLTWFHHRQVKSGYPPNWFFSPYSRTDSVADVRHWSAVSDFGGGDIKGLWEPARFGFALPMIRAYAYSGDDRYVETFWQAVESFRAENSPMCGPHWKCGQEISLRVIAWTLAFMNFRGSSATTAKRLARLAEMFEVSAARIEANIDYALSQRNNHGVSEAAGLFTVGVLLKRDSWLEKGRDLLERLAHDLIYDDGSFSQHSTNYHRLMLHDYLWCLRLGEVAGYPLSEKAIARVRRAGLWLRSVMVSGTGNVPNLGPNDGAHLLDLTDLGYADHRPTVQALGLAIDGSRWLEAGPWDELARWLGLLSLETDNTDWTPSFRALDVHGAGREKATLRESTVERTVLSVPPPDTAAFPQTHFYRDGGYVVWQRDDSTKALLRCVPVFRHRPTHCDLLHFDLWVRGKNILRDGGTYSYNCDEPWLSYFSGVAAHNTIGFDDTDPMPKLSRFLYGEWPRGTNAFDGERATSEFRDYRGIEHGRTVIPTRDGFCVEDRIQGRFRTAILRWRLAPDLNWTLTPDGCRADGGFVLLIVTSPDRSVVQRRIATGWESRYYWQKSELPVLELAVSSKCRSIVTRIQFCQ